jgi:tricorn protease
MNVLRLLRAFQPSRGLSRTPLAASAGALLLLALAAPAAAAGEDPRPLMRQPTIHGETVVFAHGGDLWSVPAAGGTAVRLTVDDGDEELPRFSPDGSLVAFTAEYDGNADVYVMSPEGGGIARVTWHPGYDRVAGWHPVSGKILFASQRHGWPPARRLWAVTPAGGGLEELPLHEAAWGSVSPDGRFLAYTPVAREHRTWKRYRGGLAQDVHLYEFATREDRRLTDFPGTDRHPMWVAAPGRETAIYFVSDRERRLNLYRLDPASGAVEQVTRHDDYDVQWPSSDGRRIVYELGGTLWVYDPAAGDPRRIPVTVAADAPEARPYFEDVADEIQDLAVSPTGARALLVARGEVFTVPAEHGPIRNLSRNSGARDKAAAWSPDGRWVAYVSDAGGEYQIHRVDARGVGEPEKLTDLPPGYVHSLRFSPDGGKIAFADHTLRLHVLDVATREVTEVDRAGHEPMDIGLDEKPIHDFAWSPDGRWLAYSKIDDDLVSQVWIYSLADRTARRAGDGRYNDFGPVFTRDGRHLLFLSQRRFDPTFDDFEWQMVYKETTGVYALTLQHDGERLLPLRSDDEPAEGEEDGEDGMKAKDGGAEGKAAKKGEGGKDADAAAEEKEVEVAIDFDGLAGRIEALPVPAGNYRALAAGDGAVFFLDADEGDFNRVDLRAVPPRNLAAFSFEEREVESVVDGVRAYALSADASHLAVYRGLGKVSLLEASARDAKPEDLDLSGLRMRIDPRAEWRQIFHEAWRMERDFFYDPNYHGLDWAATRDRYARLLPHAASRSDVGTLIGELIGELNTSHTYVFGGQRRRTAEEVGVGLLGADWEADEAAGRYRLRRILRAADWTDGVQSPLAAPGVGVAEGDFLLAVDGEEVTTGRNLYAYFADKAARQVTLRFAADPSGRDAREVRVETLAGEGDLRYLDWVEGNRRKVEEASGGRLGYVHLPDTYTGSTEEFPRTFYTQTRREGLVIDGRFNGGGLDPDIFLERLARRPLNYWTRRYSADYHNPLWASRAHMVMLTNRSAGSGGDMLPAQFRQMGLGPVIGTRTWGGLVGVSMFLELIDGGGLTVPDYRVYDAAGRWHIENVGVEPDVVVELTPAAMADGHDAQLQAAIDYLLGKLEAEPIVWPEHEAPPEGI